MTTTKQERGRAVATLTKVRTTLEPERVIEVDDAELLDLTRQGLIYTEPATEAKADKKESK